MPNFEIAEHVSLKSGSQIINLRAGIDSGAALTAVMKYVSASNDYQFYNGTKWVSMSGFKSENKNADTADTFGVLNGLSTDGTTYEFRSIKKGSSKITLTQSGGIITIDLGTVAISDITGLQDALDNKVDKVAGKGLSTEDFTTSLKDKLTSIGIVKRATPNTDQSATYDLQATFGGSTQSLGTAIDIPKDMVIQSGTVGTVTVVNQPYSGAVVGDKYIDLLLANTANTHIYIPAKSLVDVYTGTNTTEITVAVNNTTNVISATINDGSIALTKLSDITLGALVADNTKVVATAMSLLNILKTYGKNILHIDANKADESRTIAAPSASATQNAAGTANLSSVLKILIDNVKHLFDNKAENSQTVSAPTASNTQQGAGSATIVSILQTLMNNIKHLFDNKADNSQTMTAPDDTDGTQITAGSNTIINILKKLANNIAYLFTNKANNKQTVGTTTADETQVDTGELSLLSILQTYAKNIKALLAWKTAVNLQKIYVSSPLTGASGTIALATHGVTNPKIVTATLAGANMIIYTKIDPATKAISWTSQTSFIAGDDARITIIG